jgi:cytochrome c556
MQNLTAAIWKLQADIKAKTEANQEMMEALQEAIRAIQVELKAS